MKTQIIPPVRRLIRQVSLALLLTGWPWPGVAAPEAPKELLAYSEDFEGGDGGYVVVGRTSWAWGTATELPANPRGGERVWATGLTGNYGPGENGAIMSPVIDLSRQPTGSRFRLNWYQTLVTEPGSDRASVEVTRDGGVSWTRIYGEVSGEVARRWTRQSVSLGSDWAVSGFRVRFRFRSDQSGFNRGFAVDDIELVRVRNESLGAGFDSGGGHGETRDGAIALEATLGGLVAAATGVSSTTGGVTIMPGLVPLFDAETVAQAPASLLPLIRRIGRMPNGNLLLTLANLQPGGRYRLERSPQLRGGWTQGVTTVVAEAGADATQIEEPLGGGNTQYFRLIQITQ